MRRNVLIWLSFFLFVTPLSFIPRGETTTRINDVLVLIKDNPVPAHMVLNLCKQQLSKITPDVKIRYDFDRLLKGISITAKQTDIELIRKQSWVKDVVLLGELIPTAWRTPAEMVGASRLREMKDTSGNNINGRDVLIGVIDSGIDYRHKDLGEGAFGTGFKVAGGKNYVENDKPPLDDDLIGHGTMVAGIIAADSTKYQGIAYGAKLMAYRVFSAKQTTVKEDVVLAALNQAAKDGCKVINVSLSSPGGKGLELSALAKAVDSATKSGIIVVGAAGDFGTSCSQLIAGTVGGAGLATDAICVGSADTRAAFTVKVNDLELIGSAPIPYVNFNKAIAIQIVECGYGSEDELSKINVLGKYVLVQRGPEFGEPIPFFLKNLNAKKKGAAGIIVWNNRQGELIQMNNTFNSKTGESISSSELIPSVFISNADGIKLKKIVLENEEVKAAITESDFNTLARMTSIGPTEDLIFKPDVSAPGIGIMTTQATTTASPNNAPYISSFSGTSASAGIVSGVAALLYQLHPNWKPQDIKLALMNTAEILINPNSGEPSSFLLQGAGRINASAAASTPLTISPGGIIITKDTASNVKLTLKGVGVGGTFKVYAQTFGKMDNLIKFNLPSDSISVIAGKETTFTFSVEFNPKDLPWNAESVIWFESDTAKFHVPVICWKDFASRDRHSITGLKYTGSQMDYGKGTDKIDIEFGVPLGDKYSYKPLWYVSSDVDPGTPTETMVSGIQVDLIDGNGDTWVTIKRFENPQFGYYKFTWDGKDAEGGTNIPNGQFGIKVVRTEYRLDQSSTRVKQFQESFIAKDWIKIAGSKVDSPAKLYMAARPRHPTKKQMFVVDVFVAFSKDLATYSFDISFNPEEINIISAWGGDFHGLDGAPVDSEIFVTDGKIRVYSKRNSPHGMNGFGHLLSFIAKTNESTDVIYTKIKFTDNGLFDSKGNFVPHISFPLDLEISDKDPLIGDLNFDGIVDFEDWFIIAQAYGSKRGEIYYNPLADLNEDGIVDNDDVKILLANLGKAD